MRSTNMTVPSVGHQKQNTVWFRREAGGVQLANGWGCAFLKLLKLASLLTALLFININLSRLQNCLFEHLGMGNKPREKLDFLVEAAQCKSQTIDPLLPAELTVCPPENGLGIVPFISLKLQKATLLALSGPQALGFANWAYRCFLSFPPAHNCLIYNRKSHLLRFISYRFGVLSSASQVYRVSEPSEPISEPPLVRHPPRLLRLWYQRFRPRNQR